MTTVPELHAAERVPVAQMRPHPRNYRSHPAEQLDHLEASFRQFGVLPTTVLARDGTILGGHGVWAAAGRLGLDAIPATRLDLDPDEPAALKLMAALNYLGKLALDDESALAALLGEVAERDAADLLGSGWTADALTALAAKVNPEPPGEFREYGEDLATEHTCPRCGYEWSGGQ